MTEKLRGESTMDDAKSTTNANSAHGAYDEMNQLFDDIEKDPEGFKGGMRHVAGEELGEEYAQFILDALAEFPDIMRATPLTIAKMKAENPSQFLKRKAEFDEKFKDRQIALFSKLPPEIQESNLASWRTNLSFFHDSDTIERTLQDMNLVDSEEPSEPDKENA